VEKGRTFPEGRRRCSVCSTQKGSAAGGSKKISSATLNLETKEGSSESAGMVWRHSRGGKKEDFQIPYRSEKNTVENEEGPTLAVGR